MRRKLPTLGLTTLLALGCTRNPPIAPPPRRQTQIQETLLTQSAKKYLKDFFTDYVPYMSQFSDEVRTNIRTYGEEGVAEIYTYIHSRCLDLAIQSINRTTTEKEISSLAKELADYQGEVAKETHINYSHLAVIKGYAEFIKTRTDFFRRILQVNPNATDFKTAVRSTFTKEQFRQQMQIYSEKGTRPLYNGFAQSLKESKDPLASSMGPSIAQDTRERNDYYYLKETDRLYNSK